MNATHLTPEVEQRWLELRQHLDWSEGFSLVFYFSDNLAAMEKLRQRVENYYLGRSTKLKIINYERHEDWMESTLKSLLPRKSINEPIWLELNRDDGHPAQNSYRQLLLRLNERRDQLRRDLNQTLFIILPLHYLIVCRESIPDLWVVRALSEVIEQTIKASSEKMANHPSVGDVPQKVGLPLSGYQQKIVQEWQRLRKRENFSLGALMATRRAYEVLMQVGDFETAKKAADDMLKLARGMGESPESLHDLMVSLDKLG